MSKDNIGDRMKKYENADSSVLTPRTPAIIRLDGKAFHTFTKGFDYPFDKGLSNCMQQSALALAKEIPTAQLVYGQSDEVSIFVADYYSTKVQQWFGGKIQKMVSVASSSFTAKFNENISNHIDVLKSYSVPGLLAEEINDRYDRLLPKRHQAMFDARIFNLPESDVANYFYWRWMDATRNSVSMAARAHFKDPELQGVNTAKMKDKLRYEANSPWEDQPAFFKDGWIINKEPRKDSDRLEWKINPIETDIRSIVGECISKMEDTENEKEEQKTTKR